jgi:hypothetical protein
VHAWACRYQITYEDDDQEEVDWEELSALMRRAAAEDAKQVVAQQAPPIAAEPPAKAKQAKRDKETQLPDIGRKGSKLAVAASEQALKPASKRDGKPSKRLPAAEEGMVRKGKTEQEVENSCPTAVQAKPKPRIKGTSKGTGNSSKGSSSKAAPPAGKPASGKKRKAAEDAADAGGGAKKQQQRKAAGPAIELPLPKAGQEYVYKRGEPWAVHAQLSLGCVAFPAAAPDAAHAATLAGVEPWRCLEGFQWAVHDELDLSAAAVNRMRTVQRAYTKYLIRVSMLLCHSSRHRAGCASLKFAAKLLLNRLAWQCAWFCSRRRASIISSFSLLVLTCCRRSRRRRSVWRRCLPS